LRIMTEEARREEKEAREEGGGEKGEKHV